jgi:hypothetical protein
MQKVMVSTLNLGELGEQPAPAPRGSVRAYESSDDLWTDVLDERIRAGRTITLKRFALSEWYPLTPGLFYTHAGRMSREYAQSQILGAGDVGARALAELEADIGRRIPAEIVDRATRDMLRVFTPTGKISMLGGGVGCVRLKKRRVGTDELWFMSASSTPRAHEGFPVAMPDAMYQRCLDQLGEDGGLRCRLTGRLHVAPPDFDPLAQRLVGVPRVFLLAEEVVPARRRKEDFVATGVVTFETDSGDGRHRDSEYVPAERLHAAYVTFAPGRRGSLRDAVDWLGHAYVSGLFNGRIVTDFDEQLERFSDATFSLERLAKRTLEPQETGRIADEANAAPHVRNDVVARATRLSRDGRDFFVSYSSADKAWAEWIAWQIEEAGHSTEVQAWDFRPGHDWDHAMREAAERCRRTIAVLSPDYLASVHATTEWRIVERRDPKGKMGRLVPVRIQECAPKGPLKTRVWIDLLSLDEAAARHTLLAGLSECRAKPSRPPAFPGRAAPAYPAP